MKTGGILTPLETRIKVFIRDKFKCRHCGFRSIEAHHIVFRSHQGPDTLENLLSLCPSCHRGHHDGNLKIIIIDPLLGANGEIKFVRKLNWRPI